MFSLKVIICLNLSGQDRSIHILLKIIRFIIFVAEKKLHNHVAEQKYKRKQQKFALPPDDWYYIFRNDRLGNR